MAMNASPESKSWAYLSAAASLMLIASLIWAVDWSFVYILSGAAVYFLFLFYWNRPRPETSAHRPPRNVHSPTRHTSDKELIATLRETFEKRTVSAADAGGGRRSYVAVVVMSVFGGFFFLIVVLSIIFSDSSGYFEPDIYLDQAEYWSRNGEYDSADHYYQIALDLNPEYTAALVAYGNSLLARSRYDTALRTFDATLAIEETNEDALYGKALVYNYQKEYDRSVRTLQPLLRENPAHFDGLLLTGDNYYLRNRYDSAIHWYELGYATGQRTTPLCHVMAYIYDTQGETERAIELYTEALSMDSTIVDIYSRLGELFPGPEGNAYRLKVQQLKAEGY